MPSTVEVPDLRAITDGLPTARIFQREELEFENASAITNFDLERTPLAVASCVTPEDWGGLIRRLGDRGIPFAVRGGGYSPAALGSIDGGVVLSLANERTIVADQDSGVFTVGGGALVGAVESALHASGRAATLPVPSEPGFVGAALSGGVGFLWRKLGMVADGMRSAVLVTADGEVLRVSDDSHPDLMWALRGGGSNFGLVTEVEVDTHPLDTVSVVHAVFDLEDGAAELAFFDDWSRTLPDDVTAVVMARNLPPMDGVPTAHVGRPGMIVSAIHAGPAENVHADLGDLRARSAALTVQEAQLTLPTLRTATDAGFPYERFGARVRSGFNDGLDARLIDQILSSAADMPSGHSIIELARMGGAISRPQRPSAAVGRDRTHFLNFMALWTDPAQAERAKEWVDHAAGQMHPPEGAIIPSFVTTEELGSAERTYGDTYPRLQAVKGTYDPENRFSTNLNITPQES